MSRVVDFSAIGAVCETKWKGATDYPFKNDFLEFYGISHSQCRGIYIFTSRGLCCFFLFFLLCLCILCDSEVLLCIEYLLLCYIFLFIVIKERRYLSTFFAVI